MYLFCWSFSQNIHPSIARLRTSDSCLLKLEIWYPKDDILNRRDSISKALVAASPLIGSFVLGDSVHLFPAICYFLHDDSRPQCPNFDFSDDELDFGIKDFRALGHSTREKVAYFRDALLNDGKAEYDSNGFELTRETRYPSNTLLEPFTRHIADNYACLFYAYIFLPDSTVKHVTFKFHNRNEKGQEYATTFDYKRDDSLFLKIRSRLDEERKYTKLIYYGPH